MINNPHQKVSSINMLGKAQEDRNAGEGIKNVF
jgi:hypothetical protein